MCGVQLKNLSHIESVTGKKKPNFCDLPGKDAMTSISTLGRGCIHCLNVGLATPMDYARTIQINVKGY